MSSGPVLPSAVDAQPPAGLPSGGGGIRIRSVVSQVLLLVALALFVAFHFLPVSSSEKGWSIWPNIVGITFAELGRTSYQDIVVVMCFLAFTLLILASPFLTRVLEKSSWARRGILLFSGLSTMAFVGIFLGNVDGGFSSDPAILCLLWAPILNFTGLCLVVPDRKLPRMPGS